MMWTRKKKPTAQRLVMKGNWILGWSSEKELAMWVSIGSPLVRLGNATPEATGQAGRAHEEAEATEQALPGKQIRLATQRAQQRLVEVAERQQPRDDEQHRMVEGCEDPRQVEQRQQRDEDVEHHLSG